MYFSLLHFFRKLLDSILRVIVSGMIEVVANTCCDQDCHIFDGQLAEQTTQVNKAVHHLSDAETVAEVVERVVPVVLLHTQLHTQTQAPSGESLCKIHVRSMHYDKQVQGSG